MKPIKKIAIHHEAGLETKPCPNQADHKTHIWQTTTILGFDTAYYCPGIRKNNTAYNRTDWKETKMKNLKRKFDEDPVFATTVIIVGASTAAILLKAVAKTIESSAYAYRASKL